MDLSTDHHRQRGAAALIAAVVFGVLFLATSLLAMWAFSDRDVYKNEAALLAQDEAERAVAANAAELEAAFAEREKSPFRSFSSGSTTGNLSFDYPRSWSVYVEESSGNNVMSLFAHPGVVHQESSKKPYAFKAEVINQAYESVVRSYESRVSSGALTSKAFRPALVNSQLGVRLDGEVAADFSGSVVLLRLRDKTIRFTTESTDFTADFNEALKSIQYAP